MLVRIKVSRRRETICVYIYTHICLCVSHTSQIYIYMRKLREIDLLPFFFFLIIDSHSCRGWQVQNLQGRVAGWKPRKMLMLQLKSEGHLNAEFPLP